MCVYVYENTHVVPILIWISQAYFFAIHWSTVSTPSHSKSHMIKAWSWWDNMAIIRNRTRDTRNWWYSINLCFMFTVEIVFCFWFLYTLDDCMIGKEPVLLICFSQHHQVIKIRCLRRVHTILLWIWSSDFNKYC